ncbi:MAG: hypothetical protein JW739_04045 [Opitutales bacterium]|nr:hypothetical protein [Opitutales bacterium]
MRPKRRRYGIPPELDLTDRLTSVVGQRKKKRLGPILLAPFHLIAACWYWLMETKPKKSGRPPFRNPPGLD